MCDFEIDDSFLLEALEEVEKTEAKDLSILSIPPNSKICNNDSTKQENISVHNDKSRPTSSTSENNFRSKLMKSLLDSRNNLHRHALNSERKSPNDDDIFSESIFNLPSKQAAKRKSDEKEVQPVNGHDLAISSKVARISPELSHSDIYARQIRNKNVYSPCLNIESNINISVCDSPVSSTVRKRKFPGPAGLLPRWDHRTIIKSDLPADEVSKFENREDSVCSQTTAQDFVSGPWKQMQFDLDQMEKSAKHLFQNNNIRWILRRAALRGQASIRKIAFIAVMVRSIDLSHLDATAVFQDETGEIQGAISKGVLEKYSDYISTGTVFVLKDVTILSPASFKPGAGIVGQLKKHYLNITLNSVISIYSSDDAEIVKKIKVVEVTKELIKSLLSAHERKRERKEVIENEENAENEEISLFENIGCRREVAPKTLPIPNQRSFTNYKSPITASTSLSFARNVTHSATVNQASFHDADFRSSIVCKPTEQCTTKSAGINFSFNQQQTLSRNSTNGSSLPTTKLKCTTEAFQSFDDDELDAILANINTDEL